MNASNIDDIRIGYTKEGMVFLSMIISDEKKTQTNLLFQWAPAVAREFASKIIESANKAERPINVGNSPNFN